MSDAMISIRPRFADRILAGQKSIEIRNRPVLLSPGTRLWIYSTLPRGCIEAIAMVNCVVMDAPEAIWNRFQGRIGITRKEFDEYVNHSTVISAILFEQASRINEPVTLSSLRSIVPEFHPPQFIKHLFPSDVICQVLINHIRNNGYSLGHYVKIAE